MNAKVLILLFLIKSYLCEDINEIFKNVNKQYNKFNGVAASLTWTSLVDPTVDLQSKSAQYQKELIDWQRESCDLLLSLYSRGLLNDTQSRQLYLLCRGPKFTYDEARLSSTLYEKLESIYTNAEVCIPSENGNIKDLSAIEKDILKYLNSVRINSVDHVLYTAKLTIYKEIDRKDAVCFVGEDDFQKLMNFSKNEEVLRWLWLVWREKVGPPMREVYKKFVAVENQAAQRNGYPDIGSSWRKDLEIPNLKQLCRRLYEDILPLYKMIHGVARFYLRKTYGDIVPEKGPIPAHLLGDLWSQNWESVAEFIFKKSIDLNDSMKAKNWTVTHMVKRAEDFYLSIGLPPMTELFWKKSVFERRNNTTRCHGSAADMFVKDDFRLIYCMNVSTEDFYGLHHELGHIQYYMAYEDQPSIFRQANAAFHETIGDTIMLGVMTPQHLHRLGLINDKALYTLDDSSKSDIPLGKSQLDTLATNNMRQKREYNYTVKENRLNNHDSIKIKNILRHDIRQQNNTVDIKTLVEVNNTDKRNFFVKNQIEPNENDQTMKKNERTKRNKVKKFETKIKIQVKNYNNTQQVNIINDDTNNLEVRLNDKGIAKRDLNYFYNRREGTAKYRPKEPFGKKVPGDVQHLKRLHLKENIKEFIQDVTEDPLLNMKIDDLLMFKQALNKIPHIPFALLIDEYRWKYFECSLKNINEDFWKMALELQGIVPLSFRGEEYFDIGAKFHVPDNTPYIRYFLSSFLQYQLFENLCHAAVYGRRNSYEPLPNTMFINRCDIYGSKAVGKILMDFMSRGNSQDWREILQATTGQSEISSAPLLRYYRPLFDILENIIRKYQIPIGW